jgi:hypothetical protein
MMLHPIHAWVFWLPLILFLVFIRRGGPRRGLRWWGGDWRRWESDLRGWGAHQRGWGPGWEERRRSPAAPPPLDEGVRARLELVEQLESRVTELENRLDFTERLLAGRSATDPAATPRGA